MMATFTKLFEISMVASNRFGELSMRTIKPLFLLLSLFNSSFSVGFNEKKATSEPEMSAENKSRTNRMITDISTFMLKGFTNPESNIGVSKGSGSSKVYLLKW